MILLLPATTLLWHCSAVPWPLFSVCAAAKVLSRQPHLSTAATTCWLLACAICHVWQLALLGSFHSLCAAMMLFRLFLSICHFWQHDTAGRFSSRYAYCNAATAPWCCHSKRDSVAAESSYLGTVPVMILLPSDNLTATTAAHGSENQQRLLVNGLQERKSTNQQEVMGMWQQ